jgi:tRNA-dihydrouridine synthase B
MPPTVCRLLEDCGIQAIAVHGRTRAQGYSGEADWDVIGECAEAVSIPVIGNGDLASGADIARRRQSTRVRGFMIGRAAMAYPWVFREAKHFLATGSEAPPVPLAERWRFILRHARLAVAADPRGSERHVITGLRSRFMAYSKGLPGGRHLRTRFAAVASLMELDDLAAGHLAAADRDPAAA